MPQELEIRCSDVTRKARKVGVLLEEANERLNDVENENRRLHFKLASVTSNLDTTKNRLTNMEWKGKS